MSSRGGFGTKPQSTRQNVRVVCRVRPTNQKEISSGGVTCVKLNGSSIEVMCEGNQNLFSFDSIFGADSSQMEVFQDTAYPLIGDVLAGYNATIFAYGQTGTGKTHTMEGDITSQEGKGIIPRAVEALFEGVSQADENYEFTFKVSYVEIYLEKIRDLLDENRLKNNLTVREDKLKGVYIAGVTEEYVTSVQELLQIMHLGATNRATAATGMNEGSSRSHSVFTITVSQRHIINNSMKSGKLVLVDLAGSEMVRKTNSSGQQLEEAKMINKSLSALGQVINALTDDKATHVPYRDSKLTRVLQDSLGGNSKTVLIVAVSPSSYNAPETVSTLRFGTRAKSIENKVSVNQTRSIEELENLLMRAEKAIDAQTAHIISLTTQLQAANAQGFHGEHSEDGKVMVDMMRIEAEAAALKKLEDTVNSLTQELDDERQDSLRKDAEIKEMANLLREKERLIQEAANILTEVQRSNEGLKERAEQLLKEKIEAVGEVESLKSSLDDQLGKIKFEKMELELSIGTLKTENKQLRTEIAELSGDITDSVDERNIVHAKKNVVTTISAMEDDDSVFRRAARRPGDAATVAPTIVDESGKILNAAARKELIDQYNTQFAATCLKHNLSEEVSAELFGILDEFAEQCENGFCALEDKIGQTHKSQSKRIRELEDHRSRLEKDLQNRIQNMVDLQLKFDLLSRLDNKQVIETIAERERAKQKSLQQRLEQLVAVHRQLLRKFGSLELETAELKKKTTLRDERIRQLENNSRGLVGNIRQQSERYLAELATLREQIQIMKAEAEHRNEISKSLENPNNIISPMKSSNFARGIQPKSLRGGGGGIRSFFQGGDSASYSVDQHDKEAADSGSIVSNTHSFVSKSENHEMSPARNVFSRILGQK